MFIGCFENCFVLVHFEALAALSNHILDFQLFYLLFLLLSKDFKMICLHMIFSLEGVTKKL